jgi:hypothetical protein
MDTLDRDKLIAATKTDIELFSILSMDSPDDHLKAWVTILVAVYKIYEASAAKSSDNKPAAQHEIYLGTIYKLPCMIDLLSVLQLVPEEYQCFVGESRQKRAGIGHGSWLDDWSIDAIVYLSCPLTSDTVIYGWGVGDDLKTVLDDFNKQTHSMSFLDYFKHNTYQSDSKFEDWNEYWSFTFLPTTRTVIFPWNITGDHWIAVQISMINKKNWQYTIHDSSDGGMQGSYWESMVKKIPWLETLICHASVFESPEGEPIVRRGVSPQQNGDCDCGVFAVRNVIHLLEGKEPLKEDIDGGALRLDYAKLVLQHLRKERVDDSR